MFDGWLERLHRLAESKKRRVVGTAEATKLEALIAEIDKMRALRQKPDEQREEQYFTAFRILILAGEAGIYDEPRHR